MMVNLANYGTASAAGWQRQLWDIPAAIADYESGDDRGGIITPELYDDLQRGLADCERIFGPLAPPVLKRGLNAVEIRNAYGRYYETLCRNASCA